MLEVIQCSFCCENHKGVSSGPFCKLYEDEYYVDLSIRCKQASLKCKVREGYSQRSLDKVYSSSVLLKHTYINHDIIVCPNEDDNNQRVTVKERESDDVEVEVRLYNDCIRFATAN